MPEETVTAAPDLSAVESALVAIESQLIQAESVRVSERDESISISEYNSIYESSLESEYRDYLISDNSLHRDTLTVLIFGCLVAGCLLGAILYSIFTNKR